MVSSSHIRAQWRALLGAAASALILAACEKAPEPAPPTEEEKRYQEFKPPEIGFQLDSDEDIDVIRFDSTMHRGSHHMNVFKLRERDDAFEPGIRSCPMLDTAEFDYVYAAQTPTASAVLPENVALKFRARSHFMIQMHYLNAGDSDIKAGVKINLVAVKPGTIKQFAGVITATNLDIDIPPKSTGTVRGRCVPGRDFKLVGVASHAHKRLQEFKVNFFDGSGETELLYQTSDWEHPEYIYFRPPLLFTKEQGFTWACTYHNETDRPLREGGRAEDEMCIAVGYYFPAEPDEGPIYCVQTKSL